MSLGQTVERSARLQDGGSARVGCEGDEQPAGGLRARPGRPPHPRPAGRRHLVPHTRIDRVDSNTGPRGNPQNAVDGGEIVSTPSRGPRSNPSLRRMRALGPAPRPAEVCREGTDPGRRDLHADALDAIRPSGDEVLLECVAWLEHAAPGIELLHGLRRRFVVAHHPDGQHRVEGPEDRHQIAWTETSTNAASSSRARPAPPPDVTWYSSRKMPKSRAPSSAAASCSSRRVAILKRLACCGARGWRGRHRRNETGVLHGTLDIAFEDLEIAAPEVGHYPAARIGDRRHRAGRVPAMQQFAGRKPRPTAAGRMIDARAARTPNREIRMLSP